MNILIYKIKKQLPEILPYLQEIHDISIFFAYTEIEAIKIIMNFKPIIMISATKNAGENIRSKILKSILIVNLEEFSCTEIVNKINSIDQLRELKSSVLKDNFLIKEDKKAFLDKEGGSVADGKFKK